MSGYKKGQAMMEYLMTYGLAILIIVIVLAILAFFIPQWIKVPETCLFSSQGFSCAEDKHAIYFNESQNTVRVRFRLDNQQADAVVLKRAVCTNMPIGDITKDFLEGGSYSSLPNGTMTINAGGSRIINVPCVDREGNGLVVSPGADFRGAIAIEYNYQDDLSPVARTATATLSGPVLGE